MKKLKKLTREETRRKFTFISESAKKVRRPQPLHIWLMIREETQEKTQDSTVPIFRPTHKTTQLVTE